MQRTQYRRDERLNSDQEKDVQSRYSSKKKNTCRIEYYLKYPYYLFKKDTNTGSDDI